jgi:hypothetical protein
MLAAAIGLVVVLAVFGILDSLTRTQRVVESNIEETENLERIHRVMSRVFSSLSMSDAQAPPMRSLRDRQNAELKAQARGGEGSGTGGATGAASTGANASAGSADALAARAAQSLAAKGLDAASAQAAANAVRSAVGGSGSGESTEANDPPGSAAMAEAARRRNARPPERLMLSDDPSAAAALAAFPARPREMTTPQRLEVVLAESPVPILAPVQTSSAPSAPGAPQLRSFRGVFELLPEENAPSRGVVERPQSWALWWRPLPPVVNAVDTKTSEEIDATTPVAGGAVVPATKIAGGIASMQWRAFHENTRKTQYVAAWAQELPGYVEIELKTVQGRYANWMFEISWVVQSEIETDGVSPRARPAAEGREGGPRGGNRGGPPGREQRGGT